MESQRETKEQVSVVEEIPSDSTTYQVQGGCGASYFWEDSFQQSSDWWSCSPMERRVQPVASMQYAHPWSWNPFQAGVSSYQPQSKWSWSPITNCQRRNNGRWSWSPSQLKIMPVFVNTFRSKRKRSRKRRKSMRTSPYTNKREQDSRVLPCVTQPCQGTAKSALLTPEQHITRSQDSHDTKYWDSHSNATEMRVPSSLTQRSSHTWSQREGNSSYSMSTNDGVQVKSASPMSESEAEQITLNLDENNELQSKCSTSVLETETIKKCLAKMHLSVSEMEKKNEEKLSTIHMNDEEEKLINTTSSVFEQGKLDELQMPVYKKAKTSEIYTESPLSLSENDSNSDVETDRPSVHNVAQTEKLQVECPSQIDEVNNTQSLSPEYETSQVQEKSSSITDKDTALAIRTDPVINDITELLFPDNEAAEEGNHIISPVPTLKTSQQMGESRSSSPVDKLISGGLGRSLSFELLDTPEPVNTRSLGVGEHVQASTTGSSVDLSPQHSTSMFPNEKDVNQSYSNNCYPESLSLLMDCINLKHKTSSLYEKKLLTSSSECPSVNQDSEILSAVDKGVTLENSNVKIFQAKDSDDMIHCENDIIQEDKSCLQICSGNERERHERQNVLTLIEGHSTPQCTLRRTHTLTLPHTAIDYKHSNVPVSGAKFVGPVYERFDYKKNEEWKSSAVEELELISKKSSTSSVSNEEDKIALQKDHPLPTRPRETQVKSYQGILASTDGDIDSERDASNTSALLQQNMTSPSESGTTNAHPLKLSLGPRSEVYSTFGSVSVEPSSPPPAEEPSLQVSRSPSPAEEPSPRESRSPSPAEEPSLQMSRSPSPAEEPSLQVSRSPSPAEEPSPCVDKFNSDEAGGEKELITNVVTSSVKRTHNACFAEEATRDHSLHCKKLAIDPIETINGILKKIYAGSIPGTSTSHITVRRKRVVTRAVSRRLARRSPNHDLRHVAGARMEIFSALESGDFEKVQELMQDTGPAVRRRDTRCTLLHEAANYRQVDMVLFLLKFISPNVVNKDDRTPAHLAARKGHTQILRLLLADPEMDPNKRDSCNNTYKHWLTLPLLEAVLENSRARVQELLRLGADPDHSAEPPADESSARDVQITTARQLAHTLHRDNILSLFKRKYVEDDSKNADGSSENVALQELLLSKKNKGMDKEVEPLVNSSPAVVHGPDVYRMDVAPKGYVCILSYSSFQDRPDLHLEGSQTDAHNVANVFTKMGYSGHAHFSLTADQTRHQLAKVRDMELLERAGCAVFIISSHGEPRQHFLTSDMQTIDIQWVLDFFKDSQCPHLKNKPKLFIWDLCRGHQEVESGQGKSPGELCGRVDEPLRDVMCLDSSSGGFTWHAFSEEGTPFIRTLCSTLASHAPTKELTELYREFLKEYARAAPDAVPQLTNYGFNKKFYFN